MSKMLEWTPHSLGLQNIQMVINWMTKKSPTTLHVPKLLPVEFVESLRERVENAVVLNQIKSPTANDASVIQSRLQNAGINFTW